MGTKSVKFNQEGAGKLPNDKPVVYKIKDNKKNTVYVGGVNAFISTDGASSFSICNAWDTGIGGADVVHADQGVPGFPAGAEEDHGLVAVDPRRRQVGLCGDTEDSVYDIVRLLRGLVAFETGKAQSNCSCLFRVGPVG